MTTSTSTSTMNSPASTHVASCYAPNDEHGVPNPTFVEIRRFGGRGQQYAVTTVRGCVAESCEYRGTEAAALKYASSLGYTDVVR